MSQNQNWPRFATDSSLGKLAKWLRLLGFDTVFCPGKPDGRIFQVAGKSRIILTRTPRIARKASYRETILITHDKPRNQLRQVLDRLPRLNLEKAPAFSRCIRCNETLEEARKESVRGRVPDYIFQNHETFRQCPQCQRIYWRGTHVDRSRKELRKVLEAKAGPVPC